MVYCRKTNEGRFHRARIVTRQGRTRAHEVDRLQDVAEVVSRCRRDESITSLGSAHLHQPVSTTWRSQRSGRANHPQCHRRHRR